MDLRKSLRGFSFNNRHNHDEGVVMHSKSIESPSKKMIKESIPFMNGSYNFSTVGSNGEIVYGERSITIIIGLPANSKEQLQNIYSRTLAWLMDVGQSQLIFDDIPDYYYMAEVESSSSFSQVMEFGMLSVTFVAEPFKTSIEKEGQDIWDIFNFEEDYAQDVTYTVSNTLTVTVYNKGRIVTPIINVSAAMTVVAGGKTYNLAIGDNKFYGLRFKNDANILVFNGNGIAKIIFRSVKL